LWLENDAKLVVNQRFQFGDDFFKLCNAFVDGFFNVLYFLHGPPLLRKNEVCGAGHWLRGIKPRHDKAAALHGDALLNERLILPHGRRQRAQETHRVVTGSARIERDERKRRKDVLGRVANAGRRNPIPRRNPCIAKLRLRQPIHTHNAMIAHGSARNVGERQKVVDVRKSKIEHGSRL
jgi:hypothetical protein